MPTPIVDRPLVEEGLGALPLRRRAFLAAAPLGASLLLASRWNSDARADEPSRPDPERAHAGSATGRVLPRAHGFALDHIALGVPDMQRALEQIARDTGAEPYATEPEPGQWYWSGALALGPDAFLEILGPNPQHRGFQPVKELISSYSSPRLLFWYVATDDFGRFTERVEAAGAPMERVERVDFERDGVRTDYTRGVIGPGFVTQRPCVIEWRSHEERIGVDRRCQLTCLRLRHPEAAAMNELFARVGIDQAVEEGPSWIALELATPKGRVVYENEGESFVGAGSLWRMARLYLRYLGVR